MNRFYYGKAGQADYTKDRLPANRRALFFEMLRVRFSGIMGVNLLYLISCVPALIWTGLNAGLLYTLAASGGDFVSDGYLTVYLAGMIPCLGLCGVFATGEMYVLRNWARDQHAFVLSDFKDAIKGNWKCGLAAGLLNGASIFVGYVCFMFYGQMISDSPFYLVPQMLSAAIIVIWWMINMLIYPMMVTYDMKFRHLIRNSAIIAIARLPWSLLFFGGSVAVPVAIAYFVPFPYGVLAVAGLYVFIGFGLTGFVYASYANSCFDKYLNPRIEGAKVNMGLRDLDEDEDLDDVPDDHPLI